MDNAAEFVDKILEVSGKDHAIEAIKGINFFVNKNGVKRVDMPLLQSIRLFSLTQAANFIVSMVNDAEGIKPGQIMVNVINEQNVEIVDSGMNEELRRDEFGRLSSKDIFEEFEAGNKMTQEEFIIELMTKFVQDESTLELLKLVSEIKSEGETNFKDSGFSQTVAVKAGVTLVNQKQIKNLFVLRTYRTFPEIEQPLIPYILRLHDGGRDGKPMFALYSADGGQWKVTATNEIREFFTNQLNAKLGEKSNAVVIL